MQNDNLDHLEEVLFGFKKARRIIKDSGDSLKPLGYVGGKYSFYRFVNRFRLAVNLEGLNVKGYTDATVETYSSLTRVFLMWSTFEVYCELCDKQYHKMLQHFPRKYIVGLAEQYRALDADEKLIEFLNELSANTSYAKYYLAKNNKVLPKPLVDFSDGDDDKVINIIATIRHAYAHGHLTAHPKGMKSETMKKICDLFIKFIQSFIRWDFQSRLQNAVLERP